MKFIKCYIENFGTLSKYSLDFCEDLTIIKEDNGFGKSTLAAFIKAMLYGMPKTRKSNLSENERTKYTPWQGGNFGGTLDLETNGKAYRIERFFLSNGKEDFKLYDLNLGKTCNDFSENIGVELFGIDAESFERSIFIKQQGPDTSMTIGFSAKLTDLVENNNDISSYDLAMSALKKRRLYYSTQNGTRGAVHDITLEINELESKLSDSKTAIDNLDIISANIKQKKEQIVANETKCAEIRKQIRVASSATLASEVAKRKAELENELLAIEAEIKAINTKYPLGLPDDEHIILAENDTKALSELSISRDILISETADNDALDKINRELGEHIPEKSNILEIRQLIQKTDNLQIKADSLKLQLGTSNVNKEGKKTPISVTLSLLFAILTASIGVALVFVSKIIGISLFVVSAIMLGVSSFLYLKNMILSSNNKGMDIEALDEEYRLLLTEISNNQNEIDESLSKYNHISKDAANIVDSILDMLRDRERLLRSTTEKSNKINAIDEKIIKTKQNLNEFFISIGMGIPENYANEIAEIKACAERYKTLKTKPDDIKQKLSELPKTEAPADNNVSPDDVENLAATDTKLTSEIDRLRLELSTLEGRYSQLVSKADNLPEIETELENKQALKADYVKSLSVIDSTITLLEQARENLSGKYTDVMKSGFKKYAEMIIGEPIGDLIIDTNLSLNLERYGSQKEKDYFSEGYQDMFDIAMRLALIDALYKDEQPPLIFDDPFVNMDDNRIENAKQLLKKLAKNRQIIYFTCHSSRAI